MTEIPDHLRHAAERARRRMTSAQRERVTRVVPDPFVPRPCWSKGCRITGPHRHDGDKVVLLPEPNDQVRLGGKCRTVGCVKPVGHPPPCGIPADVLDRLAESDNRRRALHDLRLIDPAGVQGAAEAPCEKEPPKEPTMSHLVEVLRAVEDKLKVLEREVERLRTPWWRRKR